VVVEVIIVHLVVVAEFNRQGPLAGEADMVVVVE
jgi:hypothetical protein